MKTLLICMNIVQSSLKVSSEHVYCIFIGQLTKNLELGLSEQVCTIMHNLASWHIRCHLSNLITSINAKVIMHSIDSPSKGSICILHSPTDPRGVHLQSTICPPPVLLQSPPLPVHSSWTPHGVHMESRWSRLEVDFGLSQIQGVTEWSPGGLHVESWWTGPCGVHKDSENVPQNASTRD